MKRNLFLLTILALSIISCNPAKDISGSYSGHYTSTGLTFSGGAAQINISENGTDMVNIEFQSTYYNYSIEGINVKRDSWYTGEVFYDLSLSNSPWTVWGTVYPDGDVDYNFQNSSGNFYVQFIVS